MNGIVKSRQAKGLTQEELAVRVGVSRSSVAMWETGKAFPRASMLVALANTLKVSIEQLLTQDGEDEKKPFQEYDDSDGDRPSGLLED